MKEKYFSYDPSDYKELADFFSKHTYSDEYDDLITIKAQKELEKAIKEKEKQDMSAHLNIWNEGEYICAFQRAQEAQSAIIRFCKEVESDLSFINSRVLSLEHKPPVSVETVKEILGGMDIASLANEELIKNTEQVTDALLKQRNQISGELSKIKEQYEKSLTAQLEMTNKMNEMTAKMEHMEMPSRVQRDTTGQLMAYRDGKWSSITDEYFTEINSHYEDKNNGLFIKMSYSKYKESLQVNDIPF